jgi:rhodanese-related sulfurtransferase
MIMNIFATISPAELKVRLENGESPLMVDVREDDEVAQGMIEGAIHIPLGQISERHNELPTAVEIIVICRSGGRSGRACEFLSANGYNVTNMSGGMLEWAKL